MKKTDCFGRQNKLFCLTKQSVFCCLSIQLMNIIRAHNHENLRCLRNWHGQFLARIASLQYRLALIILLKYALADFADDANSVPLAGYEQTNVSVSDKKHD